MSQKCKENVTELENLVAVHTHTRTHTHHIATIE